MMKMRSNFQRVAALGLSFVIALGPLMTVRDGIGSNGTAGDRNGGG